MSLLIVVVAVALGSLTAPSRASAALASGAETAEVVGSSPIDDQDEPADATVSSSQDGSIVENPLGATEEDQRGSSASEDRKIWAVVGGLVFVALALTVLTFRYWRQTRPAPRPTSTRSGGRRAKTTDETAPFDDIGSDLFVDES